MHRIQSPDDFHAFDNLRRGFEERLPVRRRYSVTGDILSFRRCARQYGHFSEYSFAPAQAAQLWFGQVIHETLDRAHRQTRGQIERKDASIPDDMDIEEYFVQVSESLIARGIKPMSGAAKDKALAYLIRFNRQMGETLYPKVQDTEHRLQSQSENFVMEGIVDVLVREDADEDDPSTWEIWDYKASQVPDDDDADMRNYRYQMQVYAGLFKKKNGEYPSKAVLYFLAEDDPEDARVEIPFDEAKIEQAMETFRRTVNEIQESRDQEDWPTPNEKPSKETCDACDIRWDCPIREDDYPLRTP